MPLKDLSGKTVYDLDGEDFEELFCRQCHEYEECPRDDRKILGCKALWTVDYGTSFTERGTMYHKYDVPIVRLSLSDTGLDYKPAQVVAQNYLAKN